MSCHIYRLTNANGWRAVVVLVERHVKICHKPVSSLCQLLIKVVQQKVKLNVGINCEFMQ